MTIWVQVLRHVTDVVHRMQAPRLFGRDYRRHRRKCPVCNPAGFGRPLAIDGREYHRRLRARHRRAQ